MSGYDTIHGGLASRSVGRPDQNTSPVASQYCSVVTGVVAPMVDDAGWLLQTLEFRLYWDLTKPVDAWLAYRSAWYR